MLLATFASMRWGELAALTREDLDAATGGVHIRRGGRAARNSVGLWGQGCNDHEVGSDWFVEHAAGWEAVVAELRHQGWDVRLLTLEAPVQLKGALPSGVRFYFRARWDEVSLAVGGDDPCDVVDSEWVGYEPYGGEGWEASYLPSDDGVRLLHELVRRYHAR